MHAGLGKRSAEMRAWLLASLVLCSFLSTRGDASGDRIRHAQEEAAADGIDVYAGNERPLEGQNPTGRYRDRSGGDSFDLRADGQDQDRAYEEQSATFDGGAKAEAQSIAERTSPALGRFPRQAMGDSNLEWFLMHGYDDDTYEDGDDRQLAKDSNGAIFNILTLNGGLAVSPLDQNPHSKRNNQTGLANNDNNNDNTHGNNNNNNDNGHGYRGNNNNNNNMNGINGNNNNDNGRGSRESKKNGNNNNNNGHEFNNNNNNNGQNNNNNNENGHSNNNNNGNQNKDAKNDGNSSHINRNYGNNNNNGYAENNNNAGTVNSKDQGHNFNSNNNHNGIDNARVSDNDNNNDNSGGSNNNNNGHRYRGSTSPKSDNAKGDSTEKKSKVKVSAISDMKANNNNNQNVAGAAPKSKRLPTQLSGNDNNNDNRGNGHNDNNNDFGSRTSAEPASAGRVNQAKADSGGKESPSEAVGVDLSLRHLGDAVRYGMSLQQLSADDRSKVASSSRAPRQDSGHALGVLLTTLTAAAVLLRKA